MPHTPPTPDSLGPVLTQTGIHFSLYSEHATAVELCLFESTASKTESQRIALERGADLVWRVHVPNLKADCLYGYRKNMSDGASRKSYRKNMSDGASRKSYRTNMSDGASLIN